MRLTTNAWLRNLGEMERVDAYLDLLCRGLGRVDEKFVRTVVKGILTARSVNLSKIATALNENISLHATHKRLSRNLDNPSLQATLAQRLLELGSQEASQNTRLFVHLTRSTKSTHRRSNI
ncbi:MAG: hypothetical protein CM15mP120_09780 [Pseudomonadota bacterium]|nr:MAG: hypothetical protein CM15mP120_09780 [Pseudomonadota bacterium]